MLDDEQGDAAGGEILQTRGKVVLFDLLETGGGLGPAAAPRGSRAKARAISTRRFIPYARVPAGR